jgi:hypothetical protein
MNASQGIVSMIPIQPILRIQQECWRGAFASPNEQEGPDA